MGAQFCNGIKIALQLFLGQQLMNLRMAGTAEADDLAHGRAGEVAFVPLVVVPGARNEMMAGEAFLALAKDADSVHERAFARRA